MYIYIERRALRAPAPLARAAGGKRERERERRSLRAPPRPMARAAGGIFCFLNLVYNFFWI